MNVYVNFDFREESEFFLKNIMGDAVAESLPESATTTFHVHYHDEVVLYKVGC